VHAPDVKRLRAVIRGAAVAGVSTVEQGFFGVELGGLEPDLLGANKSAIVAGRPRFRL